MMTDIGSETWQMRKTKTERKRKIEWKKNGGSPEKGESRRED